MLELCSMEESYGVSFDSPYQPSTFTPTSSTRVSPEGRSLETLKDRTLNYQYTSETTSTAASISSPRLTSALSPNLAFSSDVQNQSSLLPKLFVGGLSHETNDTSLAKYFEQFGTLRDAMVLRDNFTMNSRGFGFVTFADLLVARQVVNFGFTREHVIDGKKVDVKFAVPKAANLNQLPTLQTPKSFLESPAQMWTSQKEKSSFSRLSSFQENINVFRANSLTGDMFSRNQNMLPHSPLSTIGANFNSTANQCYERTTSDLRRQNSAPPHMLHFNAFKNNTQAQLNNKFGNSFDSMSNSCENLLVPNKIFVGGLLYATGHESLRKFFEQFGPVQTAEVIYNRDTKKSRGFGFVIYKSFNSVEAVLQRQKVDRLLIDGKQVEVKLCKAREDAVVEFFSQNMNMVQTNIAPVHSRSNSFASSLHSGSVVRRQESGQTNTTTTELFDVVEGLGLSQLDISLCCDTPTRTQKQDEFEVNQNQTPQSPLARLNKNSAVFEPEREVESAHAKFMSLSVSQVKQSPVNEAETELGKLHAYHSFGSIGESVSKHSEESLGALKTRSWSEYNSNTNMFTTQTENRRNTFCQTHNSFAKQTDLDLLASILEEN